MSWVVCGCYVGKLRHLRGCTALLRQHRNPNKWLAQFNAIRGRYKGQPLCHNWWTFHKEDFVVNPLPLDESGEVLTDASREALNRTRSLMNRGFRCG